MKTLGIVDAVSSETTSESSRPALSKLRLAGQPLLAWGVRRISEAQRLDGIVTVIPASGDQAEELSSQVPPDAETIRSNARCPIQRIRQVVSHRDCDAVVRVSVDAPFVDPELIDQLVREAEVYADCDYVSYRCSSGQPTATSRIGLFAEWCRVAAITKAHVEQPLQNLFDYVTSQPEFFKVRLLRVPAALDRPDIRLTLQDAEDCEHIEEIIEALGIEHLDWRGIADLLEHHPDLQQRTASQNRIDDHQTAS